jgi:protein transport protein SEC23
VHELGFADCPKSYVFRGTKEYNAKQIQEMLGISATSIRPGQPQATGLSANRYVSNG